MTTSNSSNEKPAWPLVLFRLLVFPLIRPPDQLFAVNSQVEVHPSFHLFTKAKSFVSKALQSHVSLTGGSRPHPWHLSLHFDPAQCFPQPLSSCCLAPGNPP